MGALREARDLPTEHAHSEISVSSSICMFMGFTCLRIVGWVCVIPLVPYRVC